MWYLSPEKPSSLATLLDASSSPLDYIYTTGAVASWGLDIATPQQLSRFFSTDTFIEKDTIARTVGMTVVYNVAAHPPCL